MSCNPRRAKALTIFLKLNLTNFKMPSKTPIRIGTQLFAEALSPAMQTISKHTSPDTLEQIYAGIVCGMYGQMLADLGKEKADEIIKTVSQIAHQFNPSKNLH